MEEPRMRTCGEKAKREAEGTPSLCVSLWEWEKDREQAQVNCDRTSSY